MEVAYRLVSRMESVPKITDTGCRSFQKLAGNQPQGRPFSDVLRLFLSLGLLLAVAGDAHAHSPLFPQNNHAAASAFFIEDAAKSWVAYSEILNSGQKDFYRFRFSAGDPIRIKLLTSGDPGTTDFLPSLALLVPGLKQQDAIPLSMEIPSGFGAVFVRGIRPPSATYEPFAQGWFYDLADLDMRAPAEGTYYLVVFDPKGAMGRYAVTLGYLERWAPLELAALPWNIRRIQIWEGQNVFAALLPFFAVFALGLIWFFLRSRSGKTPHTLAQWFAAGSFLAFLGSAAISLQQMHLASRIAPVHRFDLIVTLIAASVPVILGLVALRYALRSRSGHMVAWRIGLITIAAAGLLLYTGLYLGPGLSLLAAVTKPGSKIGIRPL